MITSGEIRFEPLPSVNSGLPDTAADVWPTAGTTTEVGPSKVVGIRLVLRRPGSGRRVYLVGTLDTPAATIAARLAVR